MNKQTFRIDTFLKMMFRRKKLKSVEVAEKIGKTARCLNGILRHGSMKTSTLMEILEACGENLILWLSDGSLIDVKQRKDFLKDLLAQKNYNPSELSRKMGLKTPAISKLSSVEEMRLSRLFDILQALGEDFIIKLESGEAIELELKNVKKEEV